MSTIAFSGNTPLLAERLQRLRFQVVGAQIRRVVGTNIKLAREQRGWNQRQLAEQLRALNPAMAPNNTTVSEWERGIRLPGDIYLGMLLELFDLPLGWFLRIPTEDEADETPDLLQELTRDVGRLLDHFGIEKPDDLAREISTEGFPQHGPVRDGTTPPSRLTSEEAPGGSKSPPGEEERDVG